MHKTQVFIRDDQYEGLQTLAGLTNKKQSVLIREGIDLIINKLQKKQLWKEKLMTLSGTLSNQDAEEMKADIQQSRDSWKSRHNEQ